MGRWKKDRFGKGKGVMESNMEKLGGEREDGKDYFIVIVVVLKERVFLEFGWKKWNKN